MQCQIFRHPHRVTYAECTVGNHVYYSRFLDLLEAARGAFFRHTGRTLLQWQAEGMAFPVLECQLHYKAPARYDDQLTIELWLTELGKLRLSFAYRITNQDARVILTGATHHVGTSLEEKPRRLPDELKHALQPYLMPSSTAETL